VAFLPGTRSDRDSRTATAAEGQERPAARRGKGGLEREDHRPNLEISIIAGKGKKK
jgi:hypothetical protein